MWEFSARRNRHGAVVAVGSPTDLTHALGETVELVAPDSTAFARLVGVGRTFTDPVGQERAYGYLDPTSIESTAGAA